MVSIARWLDTFTCRKYADRFERLGYSTLQSICQLTSTQLQNLGVSSADICTIMENVLILKQSVHSLNSPQYLDLTSEPPRPSTKIIHFRPNNVNRYPVANVLLPLTAPNTYNDFLPQEPLRGTICRADFDDIHPSRFYSPDQQQPIHSGERVAMYFLSNNHQPSRMISTQQLSQSNITNQNSIFMNQQPQKSIENSSLSSTNETYFHPLESLERLVNLRESQVIDPKSIIDEIHNSSLSFPESLSPIPITPIISNLLTNEKTIIEQHTKFTNGLKRCSTNDEQKEFNKKSRMNTTSNRNLTNSMMNNHPVTTSLLTRSINYSILETPLPSITSLQQK